jgi:hypothetical protein
MAKPVGAARSEPRMLTTGGVALVLIAIAVIFLSLTLRDYLTAETKLTPARKAWLRIAVIFAAVAIGLFIVNTFVS